MFRSFLYSAVKVWIVIFRWYKNLYYWCWHPCTNAHSQVDIINFKIKMSEQRSILFVIWQLCRSCSQQPFLPILNICQTTELLFWGVLCSGIICCQSIYVLCPHCSEISTVPSWLHSSATKDETLKNSTGFLKMYCKLSSCKFYICLTVHHWCKWYKHQLYATIMVY